MSQLHILNTLTTNRSSGIFIFLEQKPFFLCNYWCSSLSYILSDKNSLDSPGRPSWECTTNQTSRNIILSIIFHLHHLLLLHPTITSLPLHNTHTVASPRYQPTLEVWRQTCFLQTFPSSPRKEEEQTGGWKNRVAECFLWTFHTLLVGRPASVSRVQMHFKGDLVGGRERERSKTRAVGEDCSREEGAGGCVGLAWRPREWRNNGVSVSDACDMWQVRSSSCRWWWFFRGVKGKGLLSR